MTYIENNPNRQPPNSSSKATAQPRFQSCEFGLLIFLLIAYCALLNSKIEFIVASAELLDRDSSSGRLLMAFIARTLRQFHLEQSYSLSYVFNESFIRGLQKIAAGESIRNPSAWLRSTAYRIIQELSRDQNKSVPFEDQMLEGDVSLPALSDLQDDLRTIRLALQLLDPDDQKLLTLKIVEKRTWQEIQAILRAEGSSDCSEAVLRKRKERALIRLRKKFHALKPHEF